MTTDTALVSRAQDGDDEAFRALYERHRPAVERVCRKWLRDPYLVEDAVQTTFVRAWAALPNFSGGKDIQHWLRRIAKNQCHDMWRGLARAEALGQPDGSLVEVSDAAGAGVGAQCIERLAVEDVLRKLSRRDASLLVQRHVGGWSVGSLAAHWGLTHGAMDVALHRARLRARRLARAEGLRGLLPIGLVRRLSAALQRATAASPDSQAVAFGVCNLLVVMSLVIPEFASPSDEQPRRAPQSPAITTTVASSGPAQREPRGREKAPDLRRSKAQDRAAVAAAGQKTKPAGRVRSRPAATDPPESTVSFEPVEVTGTGRTIRSAPDYDKADWEIGARVTEDETVSAEEGGTPVDERAAPVTDAACTAAKAGDPVTYCRD